MCQQQSWYDIHERRPVTPNERMTFGSAVDAAVEQIVVMLRSGNPVEMARVMAAVDEVLAREDTGVDRDEVERAPRCSSPRSRPTTTGRTAGPSPRSTSPCPTSATSTPTPT
jgi:hypothetical protein